MAHEKRHDYHIIQPSPWPLLGAVGAITLLVGAIFWMKDMTPWIAVIGFGIVAYTMYGWWRDMVQESQNNEHTPVVRIGLRMGFIMFILSEVMFFAAWFWAFFKFAIFPMVPVDDASVPTSVGPVGEFGPREGEMFDPWHLPLINTLILLLSGVTVTWAHHELIEGGQGEKRQNLIYGLMLTCFLGALFTVFQAYEYTHAEFTFSNDVYGAVFYMATGFHGFHVIVGTIFLFVCLMRAKAGHFTAKQHVGFEAAVWYWHFVDVVWLFLFACVYIWAY